MLLTVAPLSGLTELIDIFSISAEAATSSEGYTIIWSPNDLNSIRNNLSGNYILANDIDMSDFGNWQPIGSSSAPFTGIINGNGHSILNLTINLSSDASDTASIIPAAFIAVTSGATIKNLGLENASVKHSHIGYSTSGSYSFCNASGLVGEGKNSTIIEKCFFTGEIIAEASKYAYARASAFGCVTTSSTIRNCYENAKISAKADYANSMVGGIAAWNDGATIDKCYSAGSLYAENTNSVVYMGGIVGSGSGTVSNSVVLVDSITTKGITTYLGTSLVDAVCPFSTLKNNKALSSVISSIANKSATSISVSQAKTASTYTAIGWDFDSIWNIDSGYPKLIKNEGEYKDNFNTVQEIVNEKISLLQTDKYIQEHTIFTNSKEYNDLMNYYRFENNLADADNFNDQIAASVVWDLIGDVGEMAALKFDDLTMCDNPFAIVLADLITSYTSSQTLESACYTEALDVFDKTYDNFMAAIKTSDEWNESLEPKIKIEVKGILTDPNYKIQDKESFDVLKKILKGWNSTEISEVFNLLNVANDIFDVVDTIGELDSAFTKAVNAYVTATAFKNVGDDFVSTLLVVAYEMGADTFSSALFTEAILEYAELLDGKSAYNYALENLAGSLSWVSYDLIVKKLIQNAAYSFVSTALGCAPSAVGIVVFVYNTTYSILNQISALGETADLLYLIDAARQIEKGLYSNTKSAATSLQNNQTLSSAKLFDCRWGMLCALQKYEYSCAVKYASKASMTTRLFRVFNSNYESGDMKIAAELSSCWENIKCHGNTSSYGKVCSVECPTNVIVKNSSNDIVLQIEENEIKLCGEGIVVLAGDEHKYFSLPNMDVFDIEIIGTDDGTMDYTVTEIKETGIVREIQYKEVPLSEDILYNGNVSNKLYENASNYNLSSNGETFTYQNDSIENDGFSCNDMDWDEDGLTNLEECEFETNPLSSDTDGDNVYDIIEIRNDTNPLESMTDGETDDYIVVYGSPDVYIDEDLFALEESTVTCTISNKAEGKAMRTLITLYDPNGNLLEMAEVNVDSNASIEYTFPREYLIEGFKIVLDEDKITRDADYSNNEFIYVPADNITSQSSETTIVKGSSSNFQYTLTPENASKIVSWSSSDSTIVSIDRFGVITGVSIGKCTITATTATGCSCPVEVIVEPIIGAGLIDFDCRIINDNQVEIIGYVGSDINVEVPSTIAEMPVVSIGYGAFVDCTFESSILPETLKTIGEDAFYNCINLKSITIPDSVIEIGDYAFDRCSSLESVTVGKSVEEFGKRCFRECTNLKTVFYNAVNAKTNSNIFTNYYPFYDCTAIEKCVFSSDVETIPKYLFYKSTALTDVVFGSNIKSIGTYAFYGCSNLNFTSLPKTLTSIGSYAFYGCSSLSSCSLPNNLETIGGSAFRNCSSITSVSIPQNVKSIGSLAFSGCTNLAEVSILNAEASVYADSFDDTAYYNNDSNWKSGLLYIDKHLITGQDDLTAGNIKYGTTNIANSAFSGNANLTKITIPNTVKAIGSSAFSDCTNLASVTIPVGVEQINATAFSGCTVLSQVSIYNKNCFITDASTVFPETTILCGYESSTTQTYATTYNRTFVSLHEHEYVYTSITKAPTLTLLGEKELICSCGETVLEYIPQIAQNCFVDNNLLYGFEYGTTVESLLSNHLVSENAQIVVNGDKIVTGTTVMIVNDDGISETVELVVFGDTNGDGWYDGQDAVLVSCLANGMLTQDDVSEAVYMAADCNHDGVIDQLDVDLLNQAGTLLANVDQSKPAKVLLETSAAYVEYLNLIDQSPEIEVETDTEIDTEVSDVEDNNEPTDELENNNDEIQQNTEIGLVEFIMRLFEMVLKFFRSVLSITV